MERKFLAIVIALAIAILGAAAPARRRFSCINACFTSGQGFECVEVRDRIYVGEFFERGKQAGQI